MRRLLTLAGITSAISIPFSFASLAVAGPASAGPASVTGGITCSTITGNVNRGQVVISHCKPKAGQAYKSATIDDYSNTQGNLGNLDWVGGAVTTVSDITQTNFAYGAGGVCPANTFSHVDSSGTVTAASSSGTGIPALGDTVSWKVCLAQRGKLSLQFGTKIHM